jgi:hypothetical protein
MKSFLAICLIVFLAVVGCSAVASLPVDTATPAPISTATNNSSKKAKPVSTATKSQRQAIKAANGYLNVSAFSKKGLIWQLSSDAGSGFSKADAKYAVNHIDVDWNEQAVKAGQSYLDMMAFSRKGLIRQLTSSAGSQFTTAQAEYAVKKLGL